MDPVMSNHFTRRLGFLILLVIISIEAMPLMRILPSVQEAHATTTSNAVFGTITTLHHDVGASDMTPSMIKMKNGGLAVAWAQNVLTGTEDLYIMTNTGGTWIPPIAVDEGGFSGSSDNRGTSLVELPNGTLVLFWSQCPLSNGIETSCNIVFNYYNPVRRSWAVNGFSLLVSDGFFNLGPSAFMNSKGQLCVFWASDRLSPGGESDIYYTCSSDLGLTWNPDPELGQTANRMPFSVTGVTDNLPSAVPSSNGGAWLAWSSYRSNFNPSTHNGNLFFTSWNGTYWATPVQLTTDPKDSYEPSVAVSNDGGFWMVFQSDRDSTSTDVFTDLYFKRSYDPMNVTAWSTDTRLTTDTNTNWQASAFPAQPGVIGIAWSSNRPPATSFDLFYDTLSFHNLQVLSVIPTPSVQPGKIMSISVIVANRGNYTENATLNLYANSSLLTPTPISQSGIGPGLNWTASYSWNTTGRTPGVYKILAQVTCGCTEENLFDNSLVTTSIVAFRDVGIRSITIPQYIYRGQTINVSMTVVNEGNVSETFSLMLFYNSTTKPIGSLTVSSLLPKASRTMQIPWNTTLVNPGGCKLSTYIPPLPTETHLSDNNFTATYSYTSCVRKMGDVTGDRVVDINDLIAVWQHQFTNIAQYDVTGDTPVPIVDIHDLVLTYTHQFT